MKKTKKLVAAFLAAELALYAAYMCLDIFTSIDTSAIKFVSVALCFLMSAVFLRKGHFFPAALICLAMLLSLIADIFLLLLGEHYAAGVALFIAAQTVYALYIILLNGQNVWAWLGTRALTAVAAALLAAKFFHGDILMSLAAAYALLSLFNIVQALTKKDTRLLAAALILLLLCDVCVGIVNINRLFPSVWTAKLAAYAVYGMWFFYLPSQICAAFVNLRCANENCQ